MNTDQTLKSDRTADWYMDVVWPLLPVPGEFDGMDACDQLRWRSVVRLAIEYVLCGERGTPPSSKTPHCPKGDGPCIRGCKGWECRDGWPEDPTLKPDIAALKKRLAEDPGFAAQVTGDRPLRRNVDGVCTRSTCECEREGLGDQCVWLKPVDAQEHVERLSQYVMQQDMRIADLERELHALKMAAEGDEEAFAAVVEHKRKAESECQRLQGLLDAAHKIVGELARPSGI